MLCTETKHIVPFLKNTEKNIHYIIVRFFYKYDLKFLANTGSLLNSLASMTGSCAAQENMGLSQCPAQSLGHQKSGATG